MKIGFATDEITLDEYAILEELDQNGVDYELFNLNRSIFTNPLDSFKETDVDVIINRTTSSNLKEVAGDFFKSAGIKVLNPYIMEPVSNCKLATKMALNSGGVKTIDYLAFSSFPIERPKPNLPYIFKEAIAKEIEKEVLEKLGEAIGKPTRGSRGKSIIEVRKKGDFINECLRSYRKYKETGVLDNYCIFQNINNPRVIYFEKRIPHACDLRVPFIMMKEKFLTFSKRNFNTLNPLLRVVKSDEIIAKNTARGAFSLGIELFDECKKITEKSIRAIMNYTGSSNQIDGLLVGMDIIPECDDIKERQRMYNAVIPIAPLWKEHITPLKEKVTSIINGYTRLMSQVNSKYSAKKIYELIRKTISEPLKKMDEGYQLVKKSEEYRNLQSIATDHLLHCKLIPNELNLRPDFRYNTHNLDTIAIPSFYFKIAQSMA